MQQVYFILYVRDQAASARFFTAALAAAPTLDVPGITEFTLSETAKLALMPESGIKRLLGSALPDPARAQGIPRAEVYLFVDDPAACHARALAAGAVELRPLAAMDWGHDTAYCLCPDSHVLAFARVSAER